MGFMVTEMQSALRGARYPADGPALADLAESNGASRALVDALRELSPADGPSSVMQQLKGRLGD